VSDDETLSEITNRIGDYEILGVLGTGGMGRVYKVRNTLSHRVEAMKVLLPDLAGQHDLAERFLREIKVLAALEHPNIAALRTALTINNQLVMVMEYVEGDTLAKRLEQGPLPVPDTLNYIDQALAALSFAHQRQVIHRDIKPSNMMLTPQGVVKLMDFGIARSGTDRGLTMTGTTLGSLYYMSPEQVRGSNVDARSDLYSVGVSIYEMVTGQRPFQADSDFSILAAHIQQPPRPPIELRRDLPAALNDIILMAMEKDPARRFQSAESFRTALNTVRSGLAMPAAQAAPAAIPIAPGAPSVAASSAGSTGGLQPAAQTLANASKPQPSVLPPVGQYGDVAGPAAVSHRGLWMGLGAFVVLAVLVAAGLYLPRHSKAKAGEQTPITSQSVDTNTPTAQAPSSATAPATPGSSADSANQTVPPPANPPVENRPVTGSGAPSVSTPPAEAPASQAVDRSVLSRSPAERAPHNVRRPSTTSAEQVGSASTANGMNNAPVPGNATDQAAAAAAQFEELEKQFDQISTRTSAVASSLDTLQRQQASQGLNLRGDIAASQERLHTYVGKAQLAMQNQDMKNAQKYLDLAEPELEKIEKFLGH